MQNLFAVGAGGSLKCSPDSLADGDGAHCHCLQELLPAIGLWPWTLAFLALGVHTGGGSRILE